MGGTAVARMNEIMDFQKKLYEEVLRREEQMRDLKEPAYEVRPEAIRKIKRIEKENKFISEEEFSRKF